MNNSIIKDFDSYLALDELLTALKVPKDNDSIIAEIAEELLEDSGKIASPKSVHALYPVRSEGDTVHINNISIENTFVASKLCTVSFAVPYVATCGVELENWSNSLDDALERHIADTIKLLYLSKARMALSRIVKEKYYPSTSFVSSLNPGSLKEWPLEGQKDLFAILGNVEVDIGVKLTGSMLMLPTKSLSGIIFNSNEPYENCSLCPKLECPGRRAPFSGE